MEHYIYAKEYMGSTVPRTLHFKSPAPRPHPFDEYDDLESWVKVTLLNKLRNPIGTFEMEISELIDELTEVIVLLREAAKDNVGVHVVLEY